MNIIASFAQTVYVNQSHQMNCSAAHNLAVCSFQFSFY